MNIRKLIYKVFTETATESERQAVSDWIAQSDGNREEYDSLELLWKHSVRDYRVGVSERDTSLGKIKDRIRIAAGRKRKRQLWIFIAVNLMIIVGAIAFFLIRPFSPQPTNVRLRFENVPLESVIRTLETKFNVHIEVEHREILLCTFNGTFYNVASVEEVIQSVTSAFQWQYEVHKGFYVLKGKTCGDEVTKQGLPDYP
jgi:ferric-dicitrate binding protein FerR (iron transport regulator)